MRHPAPIVPFAHSVAATGLQVAPLAALSGHLWLAGYVLQCPKCCTCTCSCGFFGRGWGIGQRTPSPAVWGLAGGGGMHPQVHPRAASNSARATAARFPEGGAALHCPPPPFHVDLCADPPAGRLPYAPPPGTAPIGRGDGWGFTPPPHCPMHGPWRPCAATSAATAGRHCRCAHGRPDQLPCACSAQCRSAARAQGPFD